MTIRCYVDPQSRMLAEGLEAVELYVLKRFESQIKKPEPHIREPILVVTATGAYRGGLRTIPSTGDVYLCPDLRLVGWISQLYQYPRLGRAFRRIVQRRLPGWSATVRPRSAVGFRAPVPSVAWQLGFAVQYSET